MSVANERSTGTSYTATAALLIPAFIFIPAALIVSRPFGDAALAAAIACSLISVGLARMNWMKFSPFSVSSIAVRGTSTK